VLPNSDFGARIKDQIVDFGTSGKPVYQSAEN
jgi:hypothetical protein